MRTTATVPLYACALGLLGAAVLVRGAPGHLFAPQQVVLSPNGHEGEPHPEWGPLEHCSGIAPYHDAPGANIEPPAGCTVTSAAFLIRHSSIYANDDEWDDYMRPFAERVAEARDAFGSSSGGNDDETNALSFLRDWECPINDDNLEQLTGPGEQDAHDFGKRFRKLYPHLLPPRHLGPNKRRNTKKVKTPFKVWSASSERDIGTAKAFIRGAFPHRQEGDDGEGDGKYLELVEVPNKDPDWSASLTPHVSGTDLFLNSSSRS